MTRARQCQQDVLEEKERLRQEEDGPVITTLDSVDHGEQMEGAENLETKEGQAEVPGVSPVEKQCTEGCEIVEQTEEFGAEDGSDSVDLNKKGEEEMDKDISPEEFKDEQHSNPSLGKVRDEAQHAGSLYFWENRLLLRESYCGTGQDIVIVPKGARNKVMRLAHASIIARHFARIEHFG